LKEEKRENLAVDYEGKRGQGLPALSKIPYLRFPGRKGPH